MQLFISHGHAKEYNITGNTCTLHANVCYMQTLSIMLVFLLSRAHNKQWITIVISLFVYNSVTAVDEYCIEKPWDCCDGDSTVKPGKVFLATAKEVDSRNHEQIFSLFLTEMVPHFELTNFVCIKITDNVGGDK